jgi:5-methylthioadenosine/S-adenosylhomocysteine deaminase
VLPAQAVLRMATQNGADALGLGERIGSLAAGKFADVIAIDLSSLATQPCYDPVSQLVYAAGREHVTDVWMAGERVVVSRMPARIDVASLAQRTQGWRDQLAATVKR